MRLFLPMLVTAALAGSAAAVKINIYPNSESCDDNSGWLQCDNVAERACCQSKGRDIFSAKFIAMDSSGVPDQGVIAGGAGPCDTTCNADGTFCIDPAECPSAKGAYWLVVSGKPKGAREKDETSTACEKTVQPDRAFFSNGQSFRINYDVPDNVTALLVDLVRSDPDLSQGAPAEAVPYEILA